MVGLAPTGRNGVCVWVCVLQWVFNVIIPCPFCVQNNSNCTLATKAKMQREMTRRRGVEKEKKKRGGRKFQEMQADRGSVKSPAWNRKKGAVLWLINLGVLKEKRGGNAHFQMSRVIMQTMTQRMKEGGKQMQKRRED